MATLNLARFIQLLKIATDDDNVALSEMIKDLSDGNHELDKLLQSIFQQEKPGKRKRKPKKDNK